MIALRALLLVILTVLVIYTAIVVNNHGMGLIPIFFQDILAMGWPGQFNLDFLCFLILSATWLCWRHDFSPAGLVLGLCGFFGGAFFLSLYLIVASYKANGDFQRLLLGDKRVSQSG